MYLFSYGTLQDSKIQQCLFGKTCQMISGILKEFEVVLGDDDYFNLKHNANAKVEGKLLEVDDLMLLSADQWEEVPVYERKLVNVETAIGTLSAWVYFKTQKQTEHNLSGPEALSGYSAMALDEIFSEFIRLREVKNHFVDVYFAIPIKDAGDDAEISDALPEEIDQLTVVNIIHEGYAIRHFGCIVRDEQKRPWLLLSVPVSIRLPESLKDPIIHNINAFEAVFRVKLRDDLRMMCFASDASLYGAGSIDVYQIDFNMTYSQRLKKETQLLQNWLNFKF